MELDLETRKKITTAKAQRYQKADKKSKTRILDEFVQDTGYNRKYALHILANWNKTTNALIDGKPVKLKTGQNNRKKQKRKPGGGRPKKYDDAFFVVLSKIWAFYGFQCGKLLAPLLRLIIDFLVHAKEFGISDQIRAKLVSVSPSTIDRGLKGERKKLELKGRSLTRPGSLLKNQVKVRTFFSWDEMKPGFFEFDTVSHCGANNYGEFCCTLSSTDVAVGWVELRALRNRAHRWVVQGTDDINSKLPYPMLGLDSDNGGEFINHQLIQWCTQNKVQFTRGRPYRKNDNCFIEQKNGDIVRKAVGYYRYDTDEEWAALAEVYQYLCPLTNYWLPTIKLTGKERLPSGLCKKKYGQAKTPYQRLLESPDVSDTVKNELRRIASQVNPVEYKRLELAARDRLKKIWERK